MDEKEPYIKPEIILFDLNVEPLNAECCTTQYVYSHISIPHPACSEACCTTIESSA